MKKNQNKTKLKQKKMRNIIQLKNNNVKQNKNVFISLNSHDKLTKESFLYRLLCGSFIENLKQYLIKDDIKIDDIKTDVDNSSNYKLEKTLIYFFIAFINKNIGLKQKNTLIKIEKEFFELYTFENDDENLKLKKIFLFLCIIKKDCDLFNLVAETISCEERKNEFTKIIEGIKYENWSEKTWLNDFRDIYISLFLNVIN